MHPFNKHDAPKVKVAARAHTLPLLPVLVIIVLSVSVLLLGQAASGY